MKGQEFFASLAALAVVGIVAFYFALAPSNLNNTSVSSSQTSAGVTSSLQGGNQTIIAIYAGSTSSTSSTTTVSSVSTTSTQTQAVGGGTYTYNSSSQVKVLSVSATVSRTKAVTFSVKVRNIGSGNIYFLSGGGSSLNSTVISGGSVLTRISGPRFEIAEFMAPVSPGSDWTATTPGCWSGYHYQLNQPGTVEVKLTLTWFSGASFGSQPGRIDITAEFNLS
jgi:hypothetical protein